MSAPMRLLETSPMSARRNVAITAALADLHRAGQIPDTLRFSLYSRSVLVGHGQPLADAVQVKTCLRRGVEMARRVTGGDAVYMSPGVLAWEVIAECDRFGARLSEVRERICSGIAAGLARLGLPARFRPLNDVEIDGRRMSTSSGAIDGSTVVFQGTVLIDVDRSEMADVLRAPFAAKGREAGVATGMASLSEWLGRVPSVAELRSYLVAALAHRWCRELVPGSLTPVETRLADRLLEEGVGSDGLAAILAAVAATARTRAGNSAAERARAP